MKPYALLILAAALGLLLSACDVQVNETADQKERRATMQMSSQAAAELGMPAIHNFTEKRMLKLLYQKRDDPNYRTYTYITDMNGKQHKICDSIGYGIPYATQYSNSQRLMKMSETATVGNVLIPQPEPNGLYMPSSANGTWVMCLDPKDKETKPVYVEPNIISSPFELVAQ